MHLATPRSSISMIEPACSSVEKPDQGIENREGNVGLSTQGRKRLRKAPQDELSIVVNERRINYDTRDRQRYGTCSTQSRFLAAG